ncbi:sigma factor-like helix-turn-helix DNA-binding protein [Ktedonobacter robiniae]|uniref:RNA polymerase sigma factor 70 region 4 type 2 domain-containing protein n=1 Tax=Ktedonobacter robiniae TaxID=2778365 RepID=A0ABQ3V7N9_9CHLR|nr:sigma factor-like helix-turn-helix DNA-binding protein [Ktedonobacter robiniae]GHO61024.1 hypothetical protein KSB_94990 [Ktedonobacter robiniae]
MSDTSRTLFPPASSGEIQVTLSAVFRERETQTILMLRAVCGFTTAEIAHAFLTSEAAVARRLVRARQKIVQAGIPYHVPRDGDLDERLGEVLAALYLMFNEGYLTSRGGASARRDLAEDAAGMAAA